jgi:tRNA nucleotidyltransferase/poly(A) polymerase
MITQATHIVKILQEHGYKAVFAGGYVRDMFLNVSSHDIDIATSAAGVTAEKKIGEIKNRIYDMQLEGAFKSREDAVVYLNSISTKEI